MAFLKVEVVSCWAMHLSEINSRKNIAEQHKDKQILGLLSILMPDFES